MPRPPTRRAQGIRPRRNDSGRARPSQDRGIGGDQVEGRRAVLELMRANRRRVRDLWLDNAANPSPVLNQILELAQRQRVPVRRVGKGQLDAAARTDSPQGVLAKAEPLPDADLDDLLRSPKGKASTAPFLVALDSVTDPQNLGALLRSAEGAGGTGVLLPKHRAVHVTPAVTKAAAGAIERIPIAIVPGIPSALARASTAGLWIVGLDPGGDESIYDLDLAGQGVMLVLGAEGKGLSRLAAGRCDVVAKIPLRGALESLNVAAAGAIALFEISRRRR